MQNLQANFKQTSQIDSQKSFSLALTLREKDPYPEFFWFAFSRIRTEYGEVLCISPYLVRMRENTEQKNFERGHFSRSVIYSHEKRRVKRISNIITKSIKNFHFVFLCSLKIFHESYLQEEK